MEISLESDSQRLPELACLLCGLLGVRLLQRLSRPDAHALRLLAASAALPEGLAASAWRLRRLTGARHQRDQLVRQETAAAW